NRIEYSVITEAGEAMPEIYVKKGLLNVTRKHVPFRTITNISSRAGALDRLFGIGTVEIQTAGFSGPKSRGGPEEKIEGVVFYEEVRDFILAELRKFRAPYTTTTEVVQPHEGEVLQREYVDSEMLGILREIRDILRKQKK
ncbi:MAG: PH domain-containing protein, partial [Promethearchaeota archaeon]